jgi:hypothetical protein
VAKCDVISGRDHFLNTITNDDCLATLIQLATLCLRSRISASFPFHGLCDLDAGREISGCTDCHLSERDAVLIQTETGYAVLELTEPSNLVPHLQIVLSEMIVLP